MSGPNEFPLPRLDDGGGALDPQTAPSARQPTGPKTSSDLQQLFDVPVTVSAILGRATMPVGELLKMGPGMLLELDRRVGEAVDIRVNDRLVARGEVVLIDDRLGVTMTEIVKPTP